MLVLSRKKGERISIGDEIEVTVLTVTGGHVRIGIVCPRSIPVDRSEVLQQKQISASREIVSV